MWLCLFACKHLVATVVDSRYFRVTIHVATKLFIQKKENIIGIEQSPEHCHWFGWLLRFFCTALVKPSSLCLRTNWQSHNQRMHASQVGHHKAEDQPHLILLTSRYTTLVVNIFDKGACWNLVYKMTSKDCYIRILRLDYNCAFATFCCMFGMKK